MLVSGSVTPLEPLACLLGQEELMDSRLALDLEFKAEGLGFRGFKA